MQELLTFALILSISSTCLCRGLVEDTSGGFNVLDYGAVGDGQTDDSQVYELVSQHFINFFVFVFYFLMYAFMVCLDDMIWAFGFEFELLLKSK